MFTAFSCRSGSSGDPGSARRGLQADVGYRPLRSSQGGYDTECSSLLSKIGGRSEAKV